MPETKTTVALYPGTFNPIHAGHLEIARRALEQFQFQKVILVPCGLPPHKTQEIMAASKRFNLIQKAIKKNPALEISDVELKREGPSYTYDTVQYYKDLWAIQRVPLLIGSDALKGLSTWYKAEALIQSVTFYIYERGEDTLTTLLQVPFFAKRTHSLHYKQIIGPRLDISSTALRSIQSPVQ